MKYSGGLQKGAVGGDDTQIVPRCSCEEGDGVCEAGMVGDQSSGPPRGTFSWPSMVVLRENLFSAHAPSRPRPDSPTIVS